ncbi:MAG: beta-galactosidase family protein [Bacteroidota bacterium]
MKYKLFLLAGFMLALCIHTNAQKAKHTFAYSDTAFVLDGKPFQMISGEMHYPRVPREAWRARMKMAKAMGLNTIGTYVFWNLHEPQKGKFDFSGNNDVAEFVKIAAEEGLWVILRPSPYVCAEWEFGGYPYWLQNEKGLVVRSKEAQYLKEYETYIKEIGKQLAPLQINHGGNILMVQIENEYGSYGSDKEYLAINQRLFKEAGFDGLLYTCDPAGDLVKGHLPGLLPAANGIDNPEKVKKLIRDNHDGKGPFYIAEWYPAWFDWWGTKHHTVPAENYTTKLEGVLAAGISINMYMFHGGTTRGFMNGANYKGNTPFEPQISSYDYDAPLDEAGNATPKFKLFRDIIAKHLPAGKTLPPIPAAKPTMAIAEIKLTQSAGVMDILPKSVINKTPLTFEDLNQDYGFVLYSTTLTGGQTGVLKLNALRDYAIVMLNGKRVGVLDRRHNEDSLQITLPQGKVKLDILVENLGRINFGPYLLKNKKGITENVLFKGKEVSNWKMYSLPFSSVANIAYTNKAAANAPTVKKGTFNLTTVADTYLDMSHWGKGVVWINGHNLGRYWYVGPQQTLYLPAEWLKKGQNSIVVFELLNTDMNKVSGSKTPVLDQLQ